MPGIPAITDAEIRRGFDQMVAAAAAAGDHEAVARLEIAREYTTNQAFRLWLQDSLWTLTTTQQGVNS